MKILNVKGSYDYLPKEQRVRNYINNIIEKNFNLFGFKNIETSILCYYDMLSDKYDENNDILKEIYRLSDQGNRDLGLRYDLTVPFAKFIALNKNSISFPFKRYEIAKVFRDGPVRVGRDREFTQCDADVVGIEGQYIEAELLSIFNKTFKELDIDIYIKYNSRKLMSGLIKEAGVSAELVSSVTTILDKKDKVSKTELDGMLCEIGIDNDVINKLDKYFNMSLDKLKEFDSDNEELIKGIEEVDNLTNYLKELGLDNCYFDISLARGQNYYTGNVFEVYDKEKRISGSIGAGGRYDKMITDYICDGNSYPTVGISFGLSSIYEIIKNRDIFNKESDTDIYIIPLDTRISSIKIANIIREQGYSVEVELENKKLKKSLDYVNKSNIRYALIIGSDELDKKEFIIKDMFNGSSKSIKYDDLYRLKDVI